MHPGNLGEQDILGDNWTSPTFGVWGESVESASAENNPGSHMYFPGTSKTFHEYLAVPAAFLGVVDRFWHKARKLPGQ